MNPPHLEVIVLPFPCCYASVSLNLASTIIFNFTYFFLLLPYHTHSPNFNFFFCDFSFFFLHLQLQDLNPGLPLQDECSYHCTTSLAVEYTTFFLGIMNYSSQAHLGQMWKVANNIKMNVSAGTSAAEEHLSLRNCFFSANFSVPLSIQFVS